MAPATKAGSLRKSAHSQSHEAPENPVVSPTAKSHSSSRTSGSRSHRTRRSSAAVKSSLRDTLSGFGDDVIKVKHYPGLHVYDNHGYFHPDIPLENSNVNEAGSGTNAERNVNISSLEKGIVASELATIMSHHDPNFQTQNFERVNPSEVGIRPSKWQKLFQTSVTSSRLQQIKQQSRSKFNSEDDTSETYFEEFRSYSGKPEFDPPFWGVSPRTRRKISFLSLSLILHELACFTSCILLGCMLFQSMEAISWAHQKPFTENWIFFKWYSSLQTILVVISCLGFLNRVDTTELRSLWLLPLFLIPVLCLSISDYCKKAWDLQRLECFNYLRLDEVAKQKVYLSQDCSSEEVNVFLLAKANGLTDVSSALTTPTSLTELDARGVAPVVMRMLATVSTLVIALYLFCCRKNYYLIDLFGPPKEFCRNLAEEVRTTYGKNSMLPEDNENEYQRGKGDESMLEVVYRRNDTGRH